MKKLALMVLLAEPAYAPLAYAQCPANMNPLDCSYASQFATPQQRQMNQRLPNPPSPSQQRYEADMRGLQDQLDRNRQSNVPPQWFQDYNNQRRQ